MSRGCRICQGKPKRGMRCMFCGLQIKNKKDMDPAELHKEECFEAELEYFRTTRNKLVKFNMTTTGCRELDANIIKYIGDWLDQLTRAAQKAVEDAMDNQMRQKIESTRAETLRLALMYGATTTTSAAIRRVVAGLRFSDDPEPTEPKNHVVRHRR